MAVRKINATLVYMGESNGEPQYGHRIEFALNSTDTKPTGNLANGSTCIEVDTGNVYLWDEAEAAWVLQYSLQG